MYDDLLKTRISKINEYSDDGSCVLYVMSRDQRVADNHALLAAQKHALAKKLPLAAVFCLYGKVGVRSREHYEFMLDGLREVEKDLCDLNIPLLLKIGNAQENLRVLIDENKPDAIYFDFNPLRGSRWLVENIAKLEPSRVYVVDTHNIVPVTIASDKKEFGAYTIRPKLHKHFSTYLVEPEQLKKHPHKWTGEVKTISDLSDEIDSVLSRQKSNGTKLEFTPGEKAAHKHLKQFIDTKLEHYAMDRNDPSSGSQSDLSPYLHFGQISALRVALELQKVAQENGSDLHFLSSPKMPKPGQPNSSSGLDKTKAAANSFSSLDVSSDMPHSEKTSLARSGSASPRRKSGRPGLPEDAETTLQHGIDSLIEEMVVRKELSDNYCYYEPNYDSLDAAPDWARKTLDEHRENPRDFLYSLEQLENAQTHDEAWNAAQTQLTTTGKMHGYMRMYWAKKILEWSPQRPARAGTLDDFFTKYDMERMTDTSARSYFAKEIANSTHPGKPTLEEYLSYLSGPEWAIEVLIYLNDHYSIDGGDPNGYAGILWSVGGVHDRPWTERSVFGKIRYMNYAGLKRKFDIENYEKQWLEE